MADPAIRILTLDSNPAILDDYRRILIAEAAADFAAEANEEERWDFGLVSPPVDFPKLEVLSCQSTGQALAALEEAFRASQPYRIAFLELSIEEDLDGLHAGHAMRQIDSELFLVFVSANPKRHPALIGRQLPPQDRVAFLSKPLDPLALQSLTLNLLARVGSRRGEPLTTRSKPPRQEGQSQSGLLDELPISRALPAGYLLFDRHDELVTSNQQARTLFANQIDVLQPGSSYEAVFSDFSNLLEPGSLKTGQGAWLQERLIRHAKEGGGEEVQLRSGEVWLVAEETGPLGETSCLFFDLSRWRQDQDWRQARRRFEGLLAALTQQLEEIEEQIRRRLPEEQQLDDAMPGLSKILREQKTYLSRLSGGLIGDSQAIDCAEILRSLTLEGGPLKGGEGKIELVLPLGLWKADSEPKGARSTLLDLLRVSLKVIPADQVITVQAENTRVGLNNMTAPPGLTEGDYLVVRFLCRDALLDRAAFARMSEPYAPVTRGWRSLAKAYCEAAARVRAQGGLIDCLEHEQGIELSLFLRRHGSRSDY